VLKKQEIVPLKSGLLVSALDQIVSLDPMLKSSPGWRRYPPASRRFSAFGAA